MQKLLLVFNNKNSIYLQKQNRNTMNAIIKTLYFLTYNNKVLVCENSVKQFYEALPEEIKNERNYIFYNDIFKTRKTLRLPFNEKYNIQKIVYNK